MADFTYELGADGVAVITWDVPGKSMNVMSLEGFALLDSFIDTALADAAVKGVVITSGKKDFAGGMDLNVIAQMREGSDIITDTLEDVRIMGADASAEDGTDPLEVEVKLSVLRILWNGKALVAKAGE